MMAMNTATVLPPSLSAHDRELHRRVGGLIFVLGCCSFVCCCVLLFRRVYTGQHDYRFLVWNLILAWAPLVFATLTHRLFVTNPFPGRRMMIGLLLTLWLLFFPNAPYLVSDLKHLAFGRPDAPVWFDSVLVGSFVLTGITAGFASLVLVHDLARRRFGPAGAWTLILLTSLASGFAIYLGRFVRLNSWDLLTRPIDCVQIILRQFIGDKFGWMMQTSLMYAGFIALGYVVVMTFASVAAATMKPIPAVEQTA